MTPTDARHGSYAGYKAHHKGKIPMCAPCKEAGYKAQKHHRILGTPQQPVPLGDEAHKKIVNSPNLALSRASGVADSRLRKLKMLGPEARVRVETRQKILTAEVVTPIGLTRRMRALGRIGYSAAAISRISGVPHWSVEAFRRRDDHLYIKAGYGEPLVAAYNQLHMKPPPTTSATAQQIAAAIRNGWPGPLDYDDIDDPTETLPPPPKYEPRDDLYDEAAVLRLLAGDRIPSRKPERDEAMNRWLAMGRSCNSLEDMHGWKQGRYGRRESAA